MTTTATKIPTSQTITDHIDNVILKEIAEGRRIGIALAQLRADVERDNASIPSFAEHVAQAVLDGTDIDPAQLDVEADHRARKARNDHKFAALGEASDRLAFSPRHIKQERAGDILTYLASAMGDLTTHLRDLDPTMMVTDPELAIAGGKDAARRYEATKALVATYSTIRVAQAEAYASITHSGNLGPARERSGMFRDALDAETAWLDQRRRLGRGNTARTARIRFFLEVPVTPYKATRGGHWPEDTNTLTDRARFLHWAATKHELWVPSVDELIEADQDNSAKTYPGNWAGDVYHGPRVITN